MDTDKIIQDLNRRFAVLLPEFYQWEGPSMSVLSHETVQLSRYCSLRSQLPAGYVFHQ